MQSSYSATKNNGQITQAVDTVSGETVSANATPIPVNAATYQLTNAYCDANGNMTSGLPGGADHPFGDIELRHQR
jgi:hypothetical protein